MRFGFEFVKKANNIGALKIFKVLNFFVKIFPRLSGHLISSKDLASIYLLRCDVLALEN